jgi:hypothetical protein
MPAIGSGTVTQFFLYDVAEAIDLAEVRRLVTAAAEVRVAPKPLTPSYIQYRDPPVSFDGETLSMPAIQRFDVRVKMFDYGVISLALTQPVPDSWERLLVEAPGWHDDPALTASAEQFCRELMERLRPALSRPRSDLLSEDYLVIAATQLDDTATAERLLASHGDDIAQLLRGERELLSAQERHEVLRHRISYLATDLVVPAWNAAFVYDTEAGAQGILEILEFANSQLLEFRYYDRLLDRELARIYRQLQAPEWWQTWFARRFTRAARQVHTLFIDINELTDKTENALKIAGDVYAARLFTVAGARLGLDHWKGNVREKLKTLDDIYRFAVEQTAMARGEFLELAIVLILIFELVLFFLGVMR